MTTASTSGVCAIINSLMPPVRFARLRAWLAGGNIDIIETTGSGSAVEIARRATGYETILAVGGDGTVHEIVTGARGNGQKIGIVAGGTLNYVAKFLGIRPSGTIRKKLAACTAAPVDVLATTLTDSSGVEHSSSVLGFMAAGHAAGVARLAKRLNPIPGMFRYIAAMHAHTMVEKPFQCRVSINRATPEERTLTSAIINNCGCGSFSTVPSWKLTDGFAEVQLVRRGRVLQLLNNFSGMVPMPVSWRWDRKVQTIEISFNEPACVMVDGELVNDIVVLSAAVVPGGLQLLLPPNARLSYPR